MNKKPRLEVYEKHSILITEEGIEERFDEGRQSADTKKRLVKIKKKYEDGFLREVIEECRHPAYSPAPLDDKYMDILHQLVDSVTSEVGRGVVGLAVLQLTIKAMCPEQSVRLHKGSAGGSGFSWQNGIPMRVLDKNYNTPLLREYDLVRMNADGVFMTRSLAENYPYSRLYKAAIRGARDEWLRLIDAVEAEKIMAEDALRLLLTMLFNKSDIFEKNASKAIEKVGNLLDNFSSADQVFDFISLYVEQAEYSARVFEIAMHALFQALGEMCVLDGFLKPLSQMRSANKKHGNVGDIEVTEREGNMLIVEAWDAKYGKPYLRDELEELNEKLRDHPETSVAGFVVNGEPDKRRDIIDRIEEISEVHNCSVEILSFKEWFDTCKERVTDEGQLELSTRWLKAFTESLCQKRRKIAPIDEPSDAWVQALMRQADNYKFV